ncbi:MAG TPA: hypothetical protein VNQ32_00145 [Steroidobacteraceae bacterium]|nr:hypothetical protein [Steroidobacteraceae bacterium]
MVRILVLVLVAANLLYFGWSQWVTEQEPRLVTPPPAPAGAQAASASADSGVNRCTTLGPVADETRALEIEELLRDMQLVPSRRVVTSNAREGWWVYVNNASADDQARTLRAIQNAGIRDAFAMPDDPGFRVSVGLFMEEAGAIRRADAVRVLQLDARVSERMQQQTAVWFDLPGQPPAAVDMARFTAEGVDVQHLRLEACPSGADVSIDAILAPRAPGTGTAPGL